MKRVILFDWGNTLMVDFPQYSGKMYLWPEIEIVDQAHTTLEKLTQDYDLYIATSAQDSSESDVRAAFERGGLDIFIAGYFCKANVGIDKNCAEFYRSITHSLGQVASHVTMVGDSLEKDILPAREAGLQTVYFNPQRHQIDEGITEIYCLSQLLEQKW